MEIYDKLTKVFSKDLFDIKYTGATFNIEEEEKGAAVKRVQIVYHGKLMSIHKIVWNKTDFLFYDDDTAPEGLPKLKHSCDGVLIVEKKEQKYIVFIELKSEFSQENIRKAEKQLCASYFRTMALLQCLDIKDIDKYKKCGIIVSHKLDDSKVTFLQKIRTQKIRNLIRYERQCLTFSADYRPFPISKLYSGLDKLPVKKELIFEELPTFHVNVNRGEECVKFELDDVINQL